LGARAAGRRRVSCADVFGAARRDWARTWLAARRDEPGPARRAMSRRTLPPMPTRMRMRMRMRMWGGGGAIFEQREGFDEGRHAEDSACETARCGGEHVFVKLGRAPDGRLSDAVRTRVRTCEGGYLQGKSGTGLQSMLQATLDPRCGAGAPGTCAASSLLRRARAARARPRAPRSPR